MNNYKYLKEDALMTKDVNIWNSWKIADKAASNNVSFDS